MAMTMSQKILAAHAGLDSVRAGQLITADLDVVLGNDITSPVAIREYKKAGAGKVFDPDKICLVMDHFVPNKDIKSAQQCKCCRDFAAAEGVRFFDVGEMGIEHALLPEKGIVTAGDLVIGADSHTCTYGALGAFSTGVGSTDMAYGMAAGKAWFKVPAAIKVELKGNFRQHVSGKDLILHLIGLIGVDGALYRSLEFCGNVAALSIDDRFTVCNMAIEAGAKNGIFPVDDITRDYLKGRSQRAPKVYEADPDAEYERTIEIDLSALEPTVAKPHLPENTVTVDAIGDIKIDQVVIGSCTNGHISDLRAAAEVFKGRDMFKVRKVHKGVRAIVIPATNEIYLEALRLGYIETFIEAGAVVSTPTCGPCLGGYMGILAEGERCVATTNRNFVGRMGHVSSEIYLASPYVAACSAVLGKIGTLTRKLQGSVHMFGDNIDTDDIIPSRYLNIASAEELSTHCMENIDAQFTKKVKAGDIICAGENFGCGSSHKHAPLSIKTCGVACVVVKSFAPSFYRNAFSIDLPILECPDAVDEAQAGDILQVEPEIGLIKNVTRGKRYTAEPFPPEGRIIYWDWMYSE